MHLFWSHLGRHGCQIRFVNWICTKSSLLLLLLHKEHLSAGRPCNEPVSLIQFLKWTKYENITKVSVMFAVFFFFIFIYFLLNVMHLAIYCLQSTNVMAQLMNINYTTWRSSKKCKHLINIHERMSNERVATCCWRPRRFGARTRIRARRRGAGNCSAATDPSESAQEPHAHSLHLRRYALVFEHLIEQIPFRMRRG